MINSDYSIICEYITESGTYDAQQLIEAPDGIEAVILFLHNVRARIDAGESVTVVKITAAIQRPESGGDSAQPRTQGSGRGPGE